VRHLREGVPAAVHLDRARQGRERQADHRPSEFYIDTTICMNCGLCAEFCPFDAIKMNHDFEITAYKRMPHLIFDLDELSVPVSYYASIRPTDYAEEEAARKAKEAEKAAAKPAKPAGRTVKPAPAEAAKPVDRGRCSLQPRQLPPQRRRLLLVRSLKRSSV
jgi:ferredoxin